MPEDIQALCRRREPWINSANQLLYGGFLDQLNEKFCIEPRERADFHKSALGYDLGSIFCIEQERAITRDSIVRFENNYYQLTKAGVFSGGFWLTN